MLKAAQKGQLYCRAYELGDLDRLIERCGPCLELEDLIAAGHSGQVGWTVTAGQAVAAVAFVQLIAKDHANVAAIIDPSLTTRGWAVVLRFVRTKIRHLTAQGVKHISATIRRDAPQARAYLERLGFVDDPSFTDNPPGYLTLTRSVG